MATSSVPPIARVHAHPRCSEPKNQRSVDPDSSSYFGASFAYCLRWRSFARARSVDESPSVIPRSRAERSPSREPRRRHRAVRCGDRVRTPRSGREASRIPRDTLRDPESHEAIPGPPYQRDRHGDRTELFLWDPSGRDTPDELTGCLAHGLVARELDVVALRRGPSITPFGRRPVRIEEDLTEEPLVVGPGGAGTEAHERHDQAGRRAETAERGRVFEDDATDPFRMGDREAGRDASSQGVAHERGRFVARLVDQQAEPFHDGGSVQRGVPQSRATKPWKIWNDDPMVAHQLRDNAGPFLRVPTYPMEEDDGCAAAALEHRG